MAKKIKQISVDHAKELLWRQGILDWKLSDVQKIIKKGILEDNNKISVVLCSRRLGKTYLMCTMALEQGLSKPGSVIKFVFPKQKDTKRNILPLMRMITEDCPQDIKPVFMAAERIMRFPHNGSEIQFAGADSGNLETIRGGFAHLCIWDETGFSSDDVTYGVRSILSPTTKTTGGRVILVSTPSRSEGHSFIADWVLPYEADGRIKRFTIYDNPNFTQEIIDEIIAEYPTGVLDPLFRREYLCEIIRDTDMNILPSLSEAAYQAMIDDEFKMPPFCHKYVALDPGGKDLTAILFGYYDFERAILCVIDEIICDGSTNTEHLAAMIKEKEKLHWSHPLDKSLMPPYKRVSDVNNQILLTDLYALHGLLFTKSKKDKRDAALNSLDVDILRGNIKVHPRCKHLLYHMRYAEWNNARTDFKHLRDTPSGEIRGGHADALAALLYLHRNVAKNHNPFPVGHGKSYNPNEFQSLNAAPAPKSAIATHFSKLFKKK